MCAGLKAQEVREAQVDSTLLGRDIISVIGPGATIGQSVSIREALGKYVAKNAAKQITGYRVRVFLDNSPSARTKSESIEYSLRGQYPEHGVYRSFESPNYKVLIGDFRSKDEALVLFNSLRKTYPTAYIIKDNINYPL